VNITLGLPMVRTSVAHGTAFDIVGTGAADPASMLAAIDAAVRLVAAGWPADSLAGLLGPLRHQKLRVRFGEIDEPFDGRLVDEGG